MLKHIKSLFKVNKKPVYNKNNKHYPFYDPQSYKPTCGVVRSSRVEDNESVFFHHTYKNMMDILAKRYDYIVPILVYGSLQSVEQLRELHKELSDNSHIFGVHPIKKLDGVKVVTKLRLTTKGFFPYNITADKDNVENILTILLVHPDVVKDYIAPREGCNSNNPDDNVYSLVEIEDPFVREQLPYEHVYTFQEKGNNCIRREYSGSLINALMFTKGVNFKMFPKYLANDDHLLERAVTNPDVRKKFNKLIEDTTVLKTTATLPLGKPVHPEFIQVHWLED